LAAVVALFFAFKGSLWAPFIFLVFFNLPHLWSRFIGFRHGYGKGVRLVDVVQGRHFPDWAIRAKETTVVLLGGLCAYLTFMHMRQVQLSAADSGEYSDFDRPRPFFVREIFTWSIRNLS
jgi:PTS system mannose-specific IID component